MNVMAGSCAVQIPLMIKRKGHLVQFGSHPDPVVSFYRGLVACGTKSCQVRPHLLLLQQLTCRRPFLSQQLRRSQMADLAVRVLVRVGDLIHSCLFKEIRICLVYDRAFLNKDSRLAGGDQYQESKKSTLTDKIFHRNNLPTAYMVVKTLNFLQKLDMFCLTC